MRQARALFWLMSFVALTSVLGCATTISAPPDDAAGNNHPLLIQGYILGGPIAPASPVPGQAGSGGFTKLRYPVALAANGPDLYVADIGQRLLLRIDTVSQGVTRLRSLPALPGVRLKTDRDGSVYVVRPDSPEVERLARDGTQLGVFGARFEVLRPADVVIGPGGKLWIANTAGGVFAFHPSGRVAEPLVGRGDGFGDDVSAATLLAAGRDMVVGFDPRCRCVVEFDARGIPRGRFAEDMLLDPIDIAIDVYDRVWILDRGDRTLKVFEQWRLVGAVSAAQLGLTDISGMALDVFRAYVSDGPGGKIGIFAIAPPTR